MAHRFSKRTVSDPVTLKDLEIAVPGRINGSSVEVLAVRGDAATGQLEIAEIRDNSLAIGTVPADSAGRVIPVAEFRPWPQRIVYVGGQPFLYQWAGGRSKCAQCGTELEHFAYVGMLGGDVRERGQGSTQPISYCERCVHKP